MQDAAKGDIRETDHFLRNSKIAPSMTNRYELELTISSARDLKNVNWRHASLKPYVVLWVEPNAKFSTKVDTHGDASPSWNETLLLPVPSSIHDAALYLDIVHCKGPEDDDTKPIIGCGRLFLRDVVDEVGFGVQAFRTLELRRPSGRPQGKVELNVCVKDLRYRASEPYYAPPYGAPPPPGTRSTGYGAPPYHGAPPPDPYYSNPPPYVQPGNGQPEPNYAQPAYGRDPYGQGSYQQTVVVEEQKKKKSGMGMGTGLAVGAVAGVLGGLAIAEGVDALEDKIEDEVEERAQENLDFSWDI